MSARKGLPVNLKMRHDRHYVDSLVRGREGEIIGRMIALSEIQPNPEQPRKEMGDLDSLANSIKEQGVLEPILVNKTGDGYLIISGERRYRASKMINLQEIPCIVKNLNDAQILEMALVENLQRKDLHPFEEADGLKTLIERFKYTHDQIAQKIGKSRSSVTETLTLAGLTKEVRQAAHQAKVTAKTMLLAVARLGTVAEQLAMLEKIARGAKREDVRKQSKKQAKAKPFVFKYTHPKRVFSFNLKFKKSDVSKDEMIEVLEDILADLRAD